MIRRIAKVMAQRFTIDKAINVIAKKISSVGDCQSVTLPAKLSTQVRAVAKARRLSANRLLIELDEEGLGGHIGKRKGLLPGCRAF